MHPSCKGATNPDFMLLAVSVAVVSVALGALLALAGRKRAHVVAPVRTFALVASVAVVIAHLLPDALTELGVVALLPFGLGLVVPPVLERLAASGRGRHVGLELGFAGLLLHQIGDGLGLATFTGPHHEGHVHWEVLLAIGGHTVPVVALVVLVFAERRSVVAAGACAVALAAAAVAGALSTVAVPVATLAAWEPWITATVAGLLLHVVFHDWRSSTTEGSPLLRRVGDLLALFVGVALVWFGGHGHAEHAHPTDVRSAAGHAFVDLVVETGPVLLLGLAIAAALQMAGSRLPMRWLASGSRLGQAARGALIGAPLPICACGVLPLAQSLRTRGAGAALVVSFLFSTPELGVETFALTVRFFGWPFAAVRLAAAVLVAIVAALVLSRLAEEPAPATGRLSLGLPAEPERGGAAPRFVAHFEELLHHVGPWTLVGLVAAAFVQAMIGPDALVALSTSGADVLLVTLVAVPSYVCAASATPMAAVLLAKGLSPGAVLAGLLLGPATNVATVGFLRGAYGTRAALLGLAALVAVAWGAALGLNAAPVAVTPVELGEDAHTHGIVAWVATAVLGLLILRSVWREGLRRWLGAIGEGWGAGHGHGH